MYMYLHVYMPKLQVHNSRLADPYLYMYMYITQYGSTVYIGIAMVYPH